MNSALEDLLQRLELERLEHNLFRGTSPRGGIGRIFGGLVLAQGMRAAFETLEGRAAHSLHAYFLRTGDPERPILYEVDRIRDGGSFTTRRVVAIQGGKAILNMSVSFHKEEEGFEHQIDMQVPQEIEGEPYEDGLLRGLRELGFDPPKGRMKEQPVEIRVVNGLRLFDELRTEPHMFTWMKARDVLPDDPALHQCVLAYASDMAVMVPAIHPHDAGLMSPGVQSVSLDHAMWFHRPLRVDEWLYGVHNSPVSARARGFGYTSFYTREGVLVASCTQEGLLRRGKSASNLSTAGRGPATR